MELDWNEEQQVLQEMVRGVCAEYAPLSVVRSLEDDPDGVPTELWKQMAELGLLGILVPESLGGAEQSMLEAALLYEELGRACTPSPHLASCILSAGVLLRAGSEAQQREWLPKIASGQVILTPAWLEPRRGFGAAGVQLRAERDDGGWRLSGHKRHVPFARVATRLLVLARTGAGETEVDLFLVDPQAAGVTLKQQQSLAADTQYDVALEDVRVGGADRIGAEHSGWSTWDAVMQDGSVLLAAQAAGGADRALEITVEYARERVQFDKPLGAFQAIAHYLADASTRVDGAKTLVYEAAWSRATGHGDFARLAPMAKLFACDTFRDVTAMCQQVWGGVGFTLEYDIQLYFRRAKQLQIGWQDPRTLEARVAAAVLDGAGS